MKHYTWTCSRTLPALAAVLLTLSISGCGLKTNAQRSNERFFAEHPELLYKPGGWSAARIERAQQMLDANKSKMDPETVVESQQFLDSQRELLKQKEPASEAK